MDFPFVLSYLQSQFSGQMVLYVDDIAKMMGKSEKAVSNLIARKDLPFQVKKLGGLRCIDIFQVAQWLSSNQAMANESVAADLKPSPRNVASKPAKTSTLTTVQGQLIPVESPALTGKVAAMLLKMRHDQATGMGRFVHGLRDIDEFVFMNEVMEKLFYTADLLSSSYVVTIKRLAPKGAKILAEETRKYFATEEHAGDFLMVKLNIWRNRKALPKNKFVEHFVLEESGKTLFHAIVSDRKLSVVSNSTDIELPGL